MSRVRIYRQLPPLTKALAHFEGFSKEQSRQQVLIKELRKLAKKLRGPKSVPFYSMREVAEFFEVSLSVLSLAYQTLEREGLLCRLRSSQTMLTGKTVLSRDVIRGVVGIPIWRRSIVALPYTTTYLMEIEERLRRSGYVADIIIHERKDMEADPSFAIRLLQHRLDAVVFHTPITSSHQNLLSLKERGVRLFIIQRPEEPRDIPAVFYLTDFRSAYQKMAVSWHKAGIRKVWLWSPPNHLHSPAESRLFLTIMKAEGILVASTADEPRALLKKIRQEKNTPAAVAFLDTTNSEMLCNHEPAIIGAIARSARLAFCAGTIRAPYLQRRGILVDIVDQSAVQIASQVAADISQMNMISDVTCRTFEAEYQELQALGDTETLSILQ